MVDTVVTDYRDECRRKKKEGHPTDDDLLISVDGMYIRQGVCISRSTGEVVGYTELEGVDQDIEELVAGGTDKDRDTAQEIFNIVVKVSISAGKSHHVSGHPLPLHFLYHPVC